MFLRDMNVEHLQGQDADILLGHQQQRDVKGFPMAIL